MLFGSEKVINDNKAKYPEADNASYHPIIRDVEACFESSFSAIQLAKQYNTRLHILHISTARELQLFTNMFPLTDKRITSEVCVHHLHFTADDYARYGNLIKCNPAIKAPENKAALWEALLDDRLDIIATDHAPHPAEDKDCEWSAAAFGMIGLETALSVVAKAMIESGLMDWQTLALRMSTTPALIGGYEDHGTIEVGKPANIIVVDTSSTWTVDRNKLSSRSSNTPFHDFTLPARVTHTFFRGVHVLGNGQLTGRKYE